MHICYCYSMAIATQPASTRTVVLLRPAERKRLEKLAMAEKVSAGEILRRSLLSYQKQASAPEDEVAAMLLAQMNSALDEALASIRSAHTAIQKNLAKIDKMQREQKVQREQTKTPMKHHTMPVAPVAELQKA